MSIFNLTCWIRPIMAAVRNRTVDERQHKIACGIARLNLRSMTGRLTPFENCLPRSLGKPLSACVLFEKIIFSTCASRYSLSYHHHHHLLHTPQHRARARMPRAHTPKKRLHWRRREISCGSRIGVGLAVAHPETMSHRSRKQRREAAPVAIFLFSHALVLGLYAPARII